MSDAFDSLLHEVRACRACADLPQGPRPILQADPRARLLIVSQAPGSVGHGSGLPFADASGDRLREWLGIDHATFYDPAQVALVPMGLCYPGKGASGDLPPRRGCAPRWHGRVLGALDPRLILLVGAHAQRAYLPPPLRVGMAQAVRHAAALPPPYMALPHPAWRVVPWMRRHPWFAAETLPLLRARVAAALG